VPRSPGIEGPVDEELDAERVLALCRVCAKVPAFVAAPLRLWMQVLAVMATPYPDPRVGYEAASA
jgi:hypothetical protein